MATSTNGIDWTEVPRFTDGCDHIRSLAFGDGMFVAGVDSGDWWSSSDGETWSIYDGGGQGGFVVNSPSGLIGQIDGRNFYQGRGVCFTSAGSPNYGVMRSEAADCSGTVRVADTAHNPTTFMFGEALISEYTRAKTGDVLADCLGLP